MLYCRKCGNVVKADARFCEKCFSRLDKDGVSSAVNEYEIAAMSRNSEEFSADSYVTKSNLCGERVFGYRLTRLMGSVAESDYYTASSAADGVVINKTVRHIVFPDRESLDCLRLVNGFSDKKAMQTLEKCIKAVPQGISDFIGLCGKAGLNCAYEDSAVYRSELMGTYHVFVLMKPVIPLWQYIRGKKITLREVIGWGISMVSQLEAAEQYGLKYICISDTDIFFDDTGNVFVGSGVQGTFSDNMYLGAYSTARNIYKIPFGMDADPSVYSAGMLIYLLLNGMRHPYINYSSGQITRSGYLTAEKLRAEHAPAQMPRFARNSLGKVLLRTFSDVDEHRVSAAELNRVLKNSLIYISTEELNTVVLDIEDDGEKQC